MAANVEVVITATDKASGTIKNVTKSTEGWLSTLNKTAMGLTGLNLSTIGLSAALIKAGKFVIDATNETQKYNLAMVDMARKMGTTTEEASRLVQVGDDVRLSQEQISAAMTFAVRNGIEPNINGIAKLADQYVALETPVERGQLLLKSFGRSGIEMGKLLEKGGQGIKDMADSIESGLIVTEKGALAAQQYYIQVDRLNDSWTAFKMNIGNTVIPIMNDLLIRNQATSMAVEELGKAAYVTGGYLTAEAAKLIQLNVNLLKYGEASAFGQAETLALAKSIGVAGKSALDATTPVKGLAQAIGGLKSKDVWVTTFLQTINLGGGGGGLTQGQATDAWRLQQQFAAWKANESGQTNFENPILAPTLKPKRKRKPGATGMSSFTVQPGFDNDTFPVMAQSGERVSIETRGNTVGNNGMDLNALTRAIVRGVRDGMQRA